MADGYEHAGDGDFSDLDEWLCEYVDGTIDPVVREALEEYMQANPALACHVERLRQTRNLLCCYGCRYQAPKSLQPSLQRRLASEILHEAQPLFASVSLPFVSLAALSSMVAIFLIIASASMPASERQAVRAQFETAPLRIGKIERRLARATPLMSLSLNKYYAHFATSNASAEYARHLSPMLLLDSASDSSVLSASAFPAYSSP